MPLYLLELDEFFLHCLFLCFPWKPLVSTTLLALVQLSYMLHYETPSFVCLNMPPTDLIFPTLTKGIVPPQGIINPCSSHLCHFLRISIYRIEKFSTFTTHVEFKPTSSLYELRILPPVPLCASLNFGMLDLICYFKVQLSSVRESFVGSWNCLQFAIAVTTSSNLLVLPNCHSAWPLAFPALW